ncbi:MAG: hypothetical protein FWE40_00115 [Oscillospiraceae bacterium]|nr:hypothetical protein [Oscillospiraceae bacterium]
MLFRYIRLIIKRERINSLVWLLGIAGLMIGFAPLFSNLFGTPQEMAAIAATMNTPAMIAMVGPVYGLHAISSAMVMSQMSLLLFVIAIACMNIFFVVRHTRADEELGRMEVLRSLPIGRLTSTLATLTSAVSLNIKITVVSAIGLMFMPMDGITVAGAWVYSAALGAAGIFFAALALLMAQVFSTARGATTGAMATMSALFLLRAVGDAYVDGNWLSWLSVMGLPMQTYAFYQNRLLPIVVMLAVAAVLAAIALLLCKRRDLGEGLVPARKGAGEASPLLLSPLGFAWRMLRGSFIGWAIALFSFGAMYGVSLGMDDFFEIDMLQDMLATMGDIPNMAQGFVGMLLMMMGLLSVVPVMIAVKRVWGEEKHHRLESLYARAVPRWKMMAAFMTMGVLFSIVMPALNALGMYLASQGAANLSLGQFILGGLSYLPAIWVMLGLCVLLVGWAPKLGWIAWAVFGISFFFNYMGRLMFPQDVAEFTQRFTPFGWIPQLPVDDFAWLPLIVLTGIAAALSTVGLIGYRRRDIKL